MINIPKYLELPYCWDPKVAREVNNGCGPAGWKGKIVPDTIYLVNIKAPCLIHDFDYHIGQTKIYKIIADKRFRRNLTLTLKHEYKGWFPFWMIRCRIWLYYISVKKAGKEYFK